MNFLKNFVFGLLLFILALGLFSSQPVSAATATPDACKAQRINIANLFILSKNVPILPEACTRDENKDPRALSPSLLADVAIRAYAFFVSLAFTIVSPSLVVTGMMYMYSGIDPAQEKFLKTWVTNLATSLILVIFAYLIPFTILNIFGLYETYSKKSLDSFFTFN
jgi:hypothetical protein